MSDLASSISLNDLTPEKWKRPDEVMKLHRLRMKKKALQARMNRSDVVRLGPTVLNTSVDSALAKRKNPFRSGECIDDLKKLKSEDIEEETTCDTTLFKLLNIAEPEKNSPLSFKNILSRITPSQTGSKLPLILHEGTKEPPVDWTLRTKVRFMAQKPFPWSTTLRTCEEASGITGFVRCIDGNSGGSSLDTSPNAQFHQCCLVWQHPSLPWLELYPRQSQKGAPPPPITSHPAVRDSLHTYWADSFRSLYQLLRARQCLYFYFVSNTFTCLFRAAGVCGFPHTHVLITPTTRGFRKTLSDQEIEFRMPLCPQEGDNNDTGYETLDASQSPEVGKGMEPEEDGEEAEQWLESMGVEAAEIKRISSNQADAELGKEKRVDRRPESLVLVEDTEAHVLFNWLLNCKSCVATTGPLAGVPPTLLAPVAFHGASLRALKEIKTSLTIDTFYTTSSILKTELGHNSTAKALRLLSHCNTSAPIWNLKPVFQEHSLKRDLKWVKTGDHSIETTGVTTKILMDDLDTSVGPPEFFSKLKSLFGGASQNFKHVVNSGIQVGAKLTPHYTGGEKTHHDIWGTILATHEAPIKDGLNPPVKRHNLRINAGRPDQLGRFDESVTKRCCRESIKSVVNQNIRIDDRKALKALTSFIDYGWEWYNNEILYGKLIYYVLLIDFFTFIDVTPVALPYPKNQGPNWINVATGPDVDLDIDLIPSALYRKDLLLIEDVDFFPEELSILYWIASEGMRLDGTPGKECPHQCYTEWPSIGVTVLARRPPPEEPQEAVLVSTCLLSFASRLATRRCERGSFTRGLYLAVELFGTRLIEHEGGWWPLRSNISVHNPYVPCFVDYNFMLRLFHIYPPQDSAPHYENSSFSMLSCESRLRAVAMYNAVLGAATTTLLYNLNVTTDLISGWCTGSSDQDNEFIFKVMTPVNNSEGKEPTLIHQARKAFKIWLGVGVCDGLYPSDSWNGSLNLYPDAVHAYAHMLQTAPPTQFNPLIIDNFLILRPIEWGICDGEPKVNFASELQGNTKHKSWYGVRGSCEYQEREKSNFPMKLVVYGVQAVNVISQSIERDADNPLLISHIKLLGYNTISEPSVIFSEHPYIAPLGIFQPCTVMSYSYVDRQVVAPCLVEVLSDSDFRFLRVLNGQQLFNVGITLYRSPRPWPGLPFSLTRRTQT